MPGWKPDQLLDDILDASQKAEEMAEVQDEINFPREGGGDFDASIPIPHETPHMRAPRQARLLKAQSQPAMPFVKRNRREIGFRIERSWSQDLLPFF